MIIVFSGIANAQISGQLFQYDYEYPRAKVLIEGQSEFYRTDFDGNFELSIPENKETINLIIDLNRGSLYDNFIELKVIIKNLNIKGLTKIDLGKIHLPNYKKISIKEFEKLSKTERKQCQPDLHYANLLGYEYSNQISEDFILLTCKNKKRLTEFEFDKEKKHVIVEWKTLKNCE